jgi:hypothetical protein
LRERALQRRLGLRQVRAGFEPAHHLDPIVVRVDERLLAYLLPEDAGGAHREVELRGSCGIHAEELRRRDADHGEGGVVDLNRLADGVGRIAEPALAVTSAQDRHQRSTGAVVVGLNQATGRWHDCQSAEEVTGHMFSLRDFCLAFDDHIHASGRFMCEETGQHRRRRLVQALERGIREDWADPSPRGIPIGAAVPGMHHELVPGLVGHRTALPLHDNQ